MDCFALLDDRDGVSRLYTGHSSTLVCDDAAQLPQVLEQMQEALRLGRHAVALFSYELGAQLQGIAPRVGNAAGISARSQVLLFERCESLSAQQVSDWLAQQGGAAPAGIMQLQASVGPDEFDYAIARIHAYIEAGDTYQVNYTWRLRFAAFGGLHALYARLRERQPVPYGALIALPDGGAVLSLSPELFVRHAQGQITAQPMKGTAPADAFGAARLAADPKNRAENVMIVDLLRNDLGRIARFGSVSVPALFEVRRFGNVLQMTSTVQATVRADAGLCEVFTALFPCGSITGAPKRRTMQIIRALEPDARGFYTGAIGWFAAPAGAQRIGDFCLSVPIRTLVLQAEGQGLRQGEMGVGAGIVHDSVARDEYAECRLKANFLTGLKNDFTLFETMHASVADGCRYLDLHLQRLSASAASFGFPCDTTAAGALVQLTCAGLPPQQPHRLRLALDQTGAFTLQSAPLQPLNSPVRVLVSSHVTRADDLFLRHKSSVRETYDAAWRAAEAQGAFDMLFFNERGELTEGGRSNVFVQLDGRWWTPPLDCGLLPGVMRAVLLADPAWQAGEGRLTRADLLAAEQIVLCNALRGVLPATLLVPPVQA